MVNRVLADELQAAVGVAAIEPQTPLGKRDPEVIVLGILELLHGPDFLVGGGAVARVVAHLVGRVVAVLIHLRAVVNIEPLRLDAGRAHELHLLGLVIAQRRWTLQRVEVEFVERLLPNDRRRRVHVHRSFLRRIHAAPDRRLLKFADVARQQLDPGILEGLAALVLHGDPAHQVEHVDAGILRAIGHHQVVVRMPVHAARDVGNFGFRSSRLRGRQLPAQRRLQDRIAAQRRKQRLARQSEAQDAVHFNDGLAHAGLWIAVVLRVGRAGNVSAADDFAADGLALVATLREKINGLAFIEREQQFLGNGIVAITLLENLQRPPSQIAQDDRVRLKMRGNPGKVHVVDACVQVQRQVLAGNEEILVVDGERGRVVFFRRGWPGLLLRNSEKSKAEKRERKKKIRESVHVGPLVLIIVVAAGGDRHFCLETRLAASDGRTGYEEKLALKA